MEIQINQQPLDVSLDGNETVAAVLRQLTSWVESSGELIVETYLDGSDVSGGLSPHISTQPAAEVSQIELVTCGPLEYRLRRLTVMDNYISLLEEGVLKGSLAQIQDIAREYSYLENSLDQELGGAAGELHTILPALQHEQNELSREQRTSVATIIQMTRSLLQDRLRELTHPIDSVHDTARRLHEMLPAVAEVSIQLQSNDEREAMHTVFAAIELLSKLLRVLSLMQQMQPAGQSIPFQEISAQQEDLHRLLEELETALADNDSVTVGDILEYEIAPVLEQTCSAVLDNTPAAGIPGGEG